MYPLLCIQSAQPAYTPLPPPPSIAFTVVSHIHAFPAVNYACLLRVASNMPACCSWFDKFCGCVPCCALTHFFDAAQSGRGVFRLPRRLPASASSRRVRTPSSGFRHPSSHDLEVACLTVIMWICSLLLVAWTLVLWDQRLAPSSAADCHPDQLANGSFRRLIEQYAPAAMAAFTLSLCCHTQRSCSSLSPHLCRPDPRWCIPAFSKAFT